MGEVALLNVEKKFGETQVVHNMSLVVQDGEFLVLVGPSGCGKSTTLRMIEGLEELSAGNLFINKKLMNEVAPIDRGVAMVFQDYALYPHMTVFENLAFSLRLKKVEKEIIKQRVMEAATMLDLTEYLNRRPAALSGGQRQRVAMGRAIVKKATVFLFDEPLSNLDAKLRSKMRVEIKKFHLKAKATTVYVTHDQLEAMTLADRLVVMRAGRIEQLGTPMDVFETPRTLFVATFIGSPGMNLFNCEVRKSGNDIHLIEESGIFNFVLPSSKGQLVHDKMKVTMGIRPSDVFISSEDDGIDNGWKIAGKVELVEPLGKNGLLTMSSGKKEYISEIMGRKMPALGQEVTLSFNLHHMHLFDPKTEINLLHTGQ